jgi:hypothetical protein
MKATTIEHRLKTGSNISFLLLSWSFTKVFFELLIKTTGKLYPKPSLILFYDAKNLF